MIRIGDITPVHRPPYKDIIWSGKDSHREVDAPVLQFYEIQLFGDDGQSHRFDLEIRKSRNEERVDWYEELDTFLFQIPSREEANRLREEICMAVYALQAKGKSGSDHA